VNRDGLRVSCAASWVLLCGCGGSGGAGGYDAPSIDSSAGRVAATGEAHPVVQVVSAGDQLGWSPSPDEEDVARYDVYAMAGGATARLGSVGVSTHRFTFGELPAGFYGFYVVSVSAASVESVASPVVVAEVR